jgi:membrane protein YdbS with pleckstrin-like domain
MNLKNQYPQPRRVVLRDSFWWLVTGAALALAIVFLLDGSTRLGPNDVELLMFKKSVLLAGVVAVLIVRMSYDLLFRWTYQYGIERGRLQIRRGVVLKEEALLPLMPLTELYVKRSWLDLLFGLSNVYVAVILERAQKIGEIRGLRHKDAQKVRDEILRVIELQQVVPSTPQNPAVPELAGTTPRRLSISGRSALERLDCIEVH